MELFKNNQDQVLRSSSGNIMTRPYDFGNAFVNQGDNYIQVNREFSQYLNLYMWYYDYNSVPGAGGNTYLWEALNANSDVISCNYSTVSSGGTFAVGLNNTGTGNSVSKLIQTSSLNQRGFRNGVILIKVILTEGGMNRLRFNYATEYVYNQTVENKVELSQIGFGKVTTNYNRTELIRLNRIMLFNRELSEVEYRYLYNNRLGRDLLSKDGLLLDLHNNRAEILDFSEEQDGSDTRVGIRDFSGNNYHGEIMNLPAGTLEEQLSYANVNLFKSFL